MWAFPFEILLSSWETVSRGLCRPAVFDEVALSVTGQGPAAWPWPTERPARCVLHGCLSPARCVTAPWEQQGAGEQEQSWGIEGAPGERSVAVQGLIPGVLSVMLPRGSCRRKFGALRGVYPELLKGLSGVLREPAWVRLGPCYGAPRRGAGDGCWTAPHAASEVLGQPPALGRSGASCPCPAASVRLATALLSPRRWDPWTRLLGGRLPRSPGSSRAGSRPAGSPVGPRPPVRRRAAAVRQGHLVAFETRQFRGTGGQREASGPAAHREHGTAENRQVRGG